MSEIIIREGDLVEVAATEGDQLAVTIIEEGVQIAIPVVDSALHAMRAQRWAAGEGAVEDGLYSARHYAETADQSHQDTDAARVAAEQAQQSAESAELGAVQARAGAEAAQTAAETAQGLAQSAHLAAESAETGATQARSGAETAQGLAESAQAAAEAAETSAGQSAAQAAGSAIAAEAAHAGAEAAQGLSEDARDAAQAALQSAASARDDATLARAGAESAQNLAEGARDAALAAQGAAELAQAGAESAHDGSVVAQGLSEAARDAAALAQGGAEAARTGAETAQGSAETAAAAAASSQIASETARDGAEMAQSGAEAARTGAESAQAGAEAARTGAETAEAGAVTARQAAELAADNAASAVADHEAAENPHGVTKAQVSLGSVEDYGIATQAEAEAGAATNKYMTPQRTLQAINANASAGVPTSRTLTAGNGLSGGGDLSENRTFTLGAPGSVTATSSNDVTETSHTHALANAAVAQAKLKTTTGAGSGTVSDGVHLYTLPGGQWGFWPRLRVGSPSGDTNLWPWGPTGSLGSQLRLTVSQYSSTFFHWEQRYVQASPPYDLGDGEVRAFLFIVRERATGELAQAYLAREAPWHYNGPTNIMAHRYGPDGRAWQQVPAVVRELREAGAERGAWLADPARRAAVLERLHHLGEERTEEVELTQVVKNADMGLLPHPFVGSEGIGVHGSGADWVVQIADPMSPIMEELVALQELGEDVLQAIVLGGHLKFGRTPLKRATPPGVQAVSVAWV